MARAQAAPPYSPWSFTLRLPPSAWLLRGYTAARNEWGYFWKCPLFLLCSHSSALGTEPVSKDRKDPTRKNRPHSWDTSLLLLPPSLPVRCPSAGLPASGNWLFCWDPWHYLLHSLCWRTRKRNKAKMLVIRGLTGKFCANSIKPHVQVRRGTGWHKSVSKTALGKTQPPIQVWFLKSWHLWIPSRNGGSQRLRKKCGFLLVITEYLCPIYHWLLAMKKPDKEIWPGALTSNMPAYQRPHFWGLRWRQRSFVNSNAPELGAVLLQAEGRGREKRKRRSCAFLSRNLVLRAGTC